MIKVILSVAIMLFIATHSFAGVIDEDMAGDLKARQSQFMDELGELRGQEVKVVKSINDSIDKYSKNLDQKMLQQIIDGKSRLINILQKEEDVSQGYIDDLEKRLSDITNKEFTPLEKRQNDFKSPFSHKI